MFENEKLLSTINEIIEIIESMKNISNTGLLGLCRSEEIRAISNGIDDHSAHEPVEEAVSIKNSQKDIQIYALENDEREVLERSPV